MSVGLAKTKHRITSIKGTAKITKAMGLIAAVKIKRYKNEWDKETVYSRELENLMGALFAHDKTTEQGSHYGKPNDDSLPSLYLVISSDLGLCGAYNNEIYKCVKRFVKPTDVIAPLGSKAIHHYAHDETYKNIDHSFEDFSLSEFNMEKIRNIALSLKAQFNEKKYSRIYIIYTNYVNSITFASSRFQLLPVQLHYKRSPNEDYCPPLYDLDPRTMIHVLLSEYLTSMLYDRILDSNLSEQASRRMAMDNANDNADRLLETLTIQYNKARQNAITQEITEVVGGANAGE
ncbi:MAG: ATP synthase F1 subunit gamma [Bacilli bacterium]|nr:ATP synthase F1 subunit gamma [Bacilli bacterium]